MTPEEKSLLLETHALAKDQLRSIVERYERLSEEVNGLQGDMKDILDQAASSGFDKKALRTVIRLRRKTAEERREEEAILDVYVHALGMAE